MGWGLVGAAFLARDKGLLSDAAALAIASAVDHLGPRPLLSDLPADRVLAAVARDKKAEGGRVPFILPTAIGRVVIRPDVTRAEIRRVLKRLARREGQAS